MLTKLATFRGVSDEGEPLVRVFRQGDSIQKTAGVMMPEVQEWLGTYRSDVKKIALLINALGGSEYWGQNANGDVFPWQALQYDCRTHPTPWPIDDFTGRGIQPYGYRTFLDAHPFVHHRNKDPGRAFGNVVLSCKNPKMKRIELIAIIDRELARKFDAQHVIDAIDRGEFPDVSMGCRVPYDVCTICGHKSRTKNDYCVCIRDFGMGRLLDDGRRVGVINLYPRFFDISFVYIGADKTAKVMMKLGSASFPSIPQSIVDAERIYSVEDDEPGLIRAAAYIPPRNVVYLSGAKPKSELDLPTAQQQVDRLLRTQPESLPLELKQEAEAEIRKEDRFTGAGPSDAALRTNYGMGNETSEYLSKNGASDRYWKMLMLRNPQNPHAENEKIKKLVDALMTKLRARVSSEAPTEETRVKEGSGQEDCESQGGNWISTPERSYCEMPARGGMGIRDVLPARPDLPDGSGGQGDTGVLGGVNTVVPHPTSKTAAQIVHELASLKEAQSIPKEQIDVGPPPKNNRKEFPFVGSLDFRGIKIDIENLAGSYREGKGWRTLMKYPYGEIRKSAGTDGDKLDVYVGPHTDCDHVYVVHQNFVFGPKKGQFDEDKVMLGFKSLEHAKKSYLAHYDRPEFLRSITEMPFEIFKKKIFGELKGEKVAAKKEASLEDLFFSGQTARRRERVWKNMDTGAEVRLTGSSTAQHYDDIPKLASTKRASHAKVADIDKEIEPSGTVGRVSAALTGSEPKIPPALLDAMARCSLQEALATPSMMGMSLKPEEFQRVLLSHIGRGEDAELLERAGQTFAPSSETAAPTDSLGSESFNPEIMRMLLPMLEQRSYLSPVLVRRVSMMSSAPSRSPRPTPTESPLLTKVSAAYNWYRKEMAKVAAKYAGNAVLSHEELRARVFGSPDAGLFFAKEASDYRPHAVMAAVPLGLLVSSTIRGDMEQGRDPGLLKRLVAEHPYLAALGGAALAKLVLYSRAAESVLGRAASAA